MTAHCQSTPRPLDEFDRLAIQAQAIFAVKGPTSAGREEVAELLRNEFTSTIMLGEMGAAA